MKSPTVKDIYKCYRCGREYPSVEGKSDGLLICRKEAYVERWRYLCPECFVGLRKFLDNKDVLGTKN